LFQALRGGNVLVQRKLLAGWERGLLRRRAARLLFDFDDAVFLRDSYALRGSRHLGRSRRFAALVRDCDVVVAGNRFLADEAARHTGVGRIQVIPTCVDPDRYRPAEPSRAGAGVRLIWIGSSSTLQGLETIAPLLEEIGRRIPGLVLQLVCDRFFRLEHLPVLATPWSEVGEAQELAAADIGISWVPDDAWSQGKCGLKILQYMAAGLPVVTNPVGVHAEMVVQGETGFLASTASEWIAAVARLAADPALRQRMGSAGRQRLQARYSVAEGGRRWVALLNALEGRRSQTG
jgi:glycosyltransferase involved in cell wall biosynthesis